jgi:hypothetical protein
MRVPNDIKLSRECPNDVDLVLGGYAYSRGYNILCVMWLIPVSTGMTISSTFQEALTLLVNAGQGGRMWMK